MAPVHHAGLWTNITFKGFLLRSHLEKKKKKKISPSMASVLWVHSASLLCLFF